jgi:hypothetical protein
MREPSQLAKWEKFISRIEDDPYYIENTWQAVEEAWFNRVDYYEGFTLIPPAFVIQTIAIGGVVIERSPDGKVWQPLPMTHVVDTQRYFYRINENAQN